MSTPLENLPMQTPVPDMYTLTEELVAAENAVIENHMFQLLLRIFVATYILLKYAITPVVHSNLVKRELTDEGVLYNLAVTSIELIAKACSYGYERAVSSIASLRTREGNGHSIPGQTREGTTKRPGRSPHLE